jgi:hypothetical protein
MNVGDWLGLGPPSLRKGIGITTGVFWLFIQNFLKRQDGCFERIFGMGSDVRLSLREEFLSSKRLGAQVGRSGGATRSDD